MEGGAADRNHSGAGQGGTHTTGNYRGEGGYHGVGGRGGGASSAAPPLQEDAPPPFGGGVGPLPPVGWLWGFLGFWV